MGGRGGGWVISGHQELFSSNLVGRIFFPFFFSKSPTHPSRVKWSAPKRLLTLVLSGYNEAVKVI